MGQSHVFHIRQREDWDCGVAVAAMLAGVSYDEVVDVWQKRRAMCATELTQLLADLTGTVWCAQAHLRSRYLPMHCPCDTPVGLILENAVGIQHYVAASRTIIHDPVLPEPVQTNKYWMRLTRLRTTIRPCQPEALQNHQHQRLARVLTQLSRDLEELSRL